MIRKTTLLCFATMCLFSCAIFPKKNTQTPLITALNRADYVAVNIIINDNKRKGRKVDYHLWQVFLSAALFSENKTLPEWEMQRAADVYVEISKLFIANGADVNEAGPTEKNTPLIDAIGYYHLAQDNKNKIFMKYFADTIDLLVRNGAILSIKNKNNFSALYYALNFNTDMAFIKHLVSLGADVSEKVGKYDYPLLFHAASLETNDCFDYFLSRGADINAENQYGAGIISTLISLMNEEKKDEKAINEKINYLLKKKANINQRGSNGVTPLYIACVLKLQEVSKNLLNHKADPNLAVKDGTTCFLRALVADMDINTLEFFLKKGAKPDVFAIVSPEKNSYLVSPMIYSVFTGREDIFRLLIKYKSNPNARPSSIDTYYASPLEWVNIISRSNDPGKIAVAEKMGKLLKTNGATAFDIRPH